MSKQNVIRTVEYRLDVLEGNVFRFLDTESLMNRRSRVDAIIDLINECDDIIGLIESSDVEVSENADLEFHRKSAQRRKRCLEGWLDEIQSTFNYDEGGEPQPQPQPSDSGNGANPDPSAPKGGDNKPRIRIANKPAEPRPSDSGNGANPDPSAPKGSNNKPKGILAEEISRLTEQILGPTREPTSVGFERQAESSRKIQEATEEILSGMKDQNDALQTHHKGVLTTIVKDGDRTRAAVRDNADRVIESLSVSGSGLMLAAVLAVVAFVATLLLTGGSTTIFSDRLYKAVVWAILAFAGSALIASFLPRATGKGHNDSAAKRHEENKE